MAYLLDASIRNKTNFKQEEQSNATIERSGAESEEQKVVGPPN